MTPSSVVRRKQVTPGTEISIERTVGRLEATVNGMLEQLRLLTASIETDRTERNVNYKDIWEATRALQQEMIAERGARETVLADAKAARETLAAAALIAQTKTAQDATEAAETKTTFEAMRTDAIAAAAETARTVLAIDAKEAKRAIVYETDERRIQRNWVVERIGTVLPWLVPLVIAGVAYLLGADLNP